MRVLIADDQAWLRSAVRFLLEQELDIEVSGEASDTQTLLANAKITHPDLILIDWELPGWQPYTAKQNLIGTLRAIAPRVQIIVLSGYIEATPVALAAGANAFVSKGEPPEHLLSAIHQARQVIAIYEREKATMAEFDLAVIGGGPAGLAATVYALQAQLNVALLTPELGGKVSYPFALHDLPTVDTVWGAALVHEFEDQIKAKLKTHIPQAVTSIEARADGCFHLTLADNSVIGARAIIICTGARPQRLYVFGEKEYQGRGVSFSANSHAAFFQGRHVAVVGGERALTAVLKLAAIAERVYYIIAHKKEITGSHAAEQVVRKTNVFIYQDWEVQGIVGDDFVTGINLVNNDGELRTVPVEGVFVEAGLLPNNELVHDLVTIDEDGYIVVNQRCETNLSGLFAAGDVTNVHAEQVPVAIGEGVKAALSAWAYLARRTVS